MNPWDLYASRMEMLGETQREATLRRAQRALSRKLPASLAYHQVLIDGEERQIAVINSDALDTKRIVSLPNESLPHGGLVHWMDHHWLITDKDYNTEVCTRAEMRQCNYLLRWIASDGSIVERWCIVEDGTKYMIGESGDGSNIIVSGDSRIAVTLSKDGYSLALGRNNRFLIDDYASPSVLAYRLTKPLKLGGSYDSHGVLRFILTECNTEDSDNFELRIANYYDAFPDEAESNDTQHEMTSGSVESVLDSTGDTGKKVWF